MAVMTTVVSLLVCSTASAAAPLSERQIAEQAVKSYTPQAVKEVQQAKKEGVASEEALLKRVLGAKPGASANGVPTTTAQEFALAVAAKKLIKKHVEKSARSKVKKSETAPESTPSEYEESASTTAKMASSGCWFSGSWIRNGTWFSAAGAWVGDYYIYHGVWCGNGYSITYNGLGYWKEARAEFPFCGEASMNYGWDAPHYAWAHGKISDYFGAYTPWGSCGYGSWHEAEVRIDADGYHDYAKDM